MNNNTDVKLPCLIIAKELGPANNNTDVKLPCLIIAKELGPATQNDSIQNTSC